MTLTAAPVPASAPAELVAELSALQQLAVRHRREYIRLRTIELAKLTGTQPRFTRDRMTHEQLEALPPVTDSAGVELAAGQRVCCPDGVEAIVRRVDKRSKRCVVDRKDGLAKMTVAKKLTVLLPQQTRRRAKVAS